MCSYGRMSGNAISILGLFFFYTELFQFNSYFTNIVHRVQSCGTEKNCIWWWWAMYQTVIHTPTAHLIQFPQTAPDMIYGSALLHCELLIKNMFSFCRSVLSWLVIKNHNLQGWQIPAGRWNSERERGFPQVAMSCSQNLVQFWRTCHCRGLTMEEARNLLRSCQGEVSSSHCRIIWNIYHQLWITNFYLNSQCPGNYGHHHYFPGGYHHSQRPRERASGTNCAGKFPMEFFFY